MAEALNERMAGVSRFISEGAPETALSAIREVLADPHGSHPAVQLNCAGFLIDTGERLDREDLVTEGVEMLEKLRSSGAFPDGTETNAHLRYNLANGLAAPLHMASRRRAAPDRWVKDMRAEEAIVSLYYESTDLLRSAMPSVVINCAALLRLEGRIYEGIDLLDFVLQHHPAHPNAHQKMADLLVLAGRNIQGRDSMVEALLVPACVHYARAIDAFTAAEEPDFAERTRTALLSVKELAGRVLGGDLDSAIANVGDKLFGTERFGEPMGLSLLARSPYRDEDDLGLAEGVATELRDIVVDAAGTFCVGRSLLMQAEQPALRMPQWGNHTPDASAHLRNAAVRQFWSVMEKVAWLTNAAFKVGLKESECSFASLFRAPSDKVRKALKLAPEARFYPALSIENAGLRALAGLSSAFDAENGSVYVPLKRLRHAVEHRV